MEEKIRKQIIEEHGKPFIKIGSFLKPNPGCLCAMFEASHKVRYIRPLKRFEAYNESEKVWKNISEDQITSAIRQTALDAAPEYDRGLLNAILTYPTLSGITKLLRSMVGIDEPPMPPCRFIQVQDTLLIFDETAQTFKSVPAAPEYNSRHRIERRYNPEAQCPRFLNELVRPMLKYEAALKLIQLYFGQCLLNDNISQTFLMISGPASIGKSVLVSVIEGILGEENVTELHPERLATPFELAEYASKSLLTAKDIENDALSANKINAIKKMTGNDLLAAEQKNRNTRLYVRGSFNIIITGNGDLTLNLGSSRDAFKRRMIWIDGQTPKQFNRIAGFDKLLLAEEGDGILAWAIEGARMLLSAGGIISKDGEQEKALEYLLGESAPVETFIRECVRCDRDNAIRSEDVAPLFFRFATQAGWNNATVFNLTDRQIRMQFKCLMSRLHPECRYNNHIRVQGTSEQLRGYKDCSIRIPECKNIRTSVPLQA